MEEQPVQEASQPTPPPKNKSMLNVWRVLTVVLFVILLVGGGYLIGFQKNSNVPTPTPTPQISTSPTQVTNQSPTLTSSVSPVPSKTPSKTVEAGQASAWVFLPYRISVPTDWTTDHQSTKDVVDDLRITRGAYKISIRQFGGEGHKCLYGNEPDEQFTQKYKTYVEFNSLDETFRRSGETGGTGWTLCHKITDGWGAPTLYGYISYSNPANADENILKEMDSILATIVKQ